MSEEAAYRRAIHDAVEVIKRYGEINMEACGDYILIDPVLHGKGFSDVNIKISDDCSVMSTIHSAKYHACEEVATNVLALLTQGAHRSAGDGE
jgi:hypothetical protein